MEIAKGVGRDKDLTPWQPGTGVRDQIAYRPLLVVKVEVLDMSDFTVGRTECVPVQLLDASYHDGHLSSLSAARASSSPFTPICAAFGTSAPTSRLLRIIVQPPLLLSYEVSRLGVWLWAVGLVLLHPVTPTSSGSVPRHRLKPSIVGRLPRLSAVFIM
jgi:hypothetical protein